MLLLLSCYIRGRHRGGCTAPAILGAGTGDGVMFLLYQGRAQWCVCCSWHSRWGTYLKLANKKMSGANICKRKITLPNSLLYICTFMIILLNNNNDSDNNDLGAKEMKVDWL